MALKPFRVVVSGSTSNLGPGFDCLGLAVDLELALEVRPAPGAGSPEPAWRERSGTLQGEPAGDGERIVQGLRAAERASGRALPPIELWARSTIPVARGLGSSGAAAVAGLVAGFHALESRVEPDRLFELGCTLEGHPDNVGPALFGGCVVAMPDTAGRVVWFETPVHSDLRVAVAWPRSRVETRHARSVLPESVPFAVARDQARRLAQLLRGLADLDPARLALGSRDELHTPYRAPLIPGCAEVLAAALEAGALASAISGSGSGIVALGAGSMGRVAEAMGRAFARAGEQAETRDLAVPRRGFRIEPL